MPANGQQETVVTREVVKSARVVTGIELTTGLALLFFAAAVPVATALWWGRPTTFQELASLIFLGTFMFCVIATFAVIILWGLGRLDLPSKFVGWLGGATIGEVAGLVAFVLHWIFRS